MGKLICFYKNMQSDILNLYLQKHFIKKGTFFSSEFEGALFKKAGQLCSQ